VFDRAEALGWARLLDRVAVSLIAPVAVSLTTPVAVLPDGGAALLLVSGNTAVLVSRPLWLRSDRSEREQAVPVRTTALANIPRNSARLESEKLIYLSSTWFVTSNA
jgi:hypothetical protein